MVTSTFQVTAQHLPEGTGFTSLKKKKEKKLSDHQPWSQTTNYNFSANIINGSQMIQSRPRAGMSRRGAPAQQTERTWLPCSCCLPATTEACLHELLLLFSAPSVVYVQLLNGRNRLNEAEKHLQTPCWSQLGNDTTAPVPKWTTGPWSFRGRKWRTIHAVISCGLSCRAAANNCAMIKNSSFAHVSALMSYSNCTAHQSPAQQANSPQTLDILEDIKRHQGTPCPMLL